MKPKRNTVQNAIVLESVLRRKDHPTAEDIYNDIHCSHPKISKATVYRNLNKLCECDKILKIRTPIGADRFDITTFKHYHFCCQKCGKLFDLDGLPYDSTLDSKITELGYKGIRHRLVFEGLCPDCRNTEN